MFEIKVKIEAPELAGAIVKLADVLSVTPVVYNVADNTAPAEPVAEKPAPVAPAEPVAPAPVAQTPVAPAPAPVAPTPAAKPVDINAIARAGAGLIDKGMMPQIMELLKKYGVQAVTQLKDEQFADFAADLRQLGAEI